MNRAAVFVLLLALGGMLATPTAARRPVGHAWTPPRPLASSSFAAAATFGLNVKDFGAVGDGKTDDTQVPFVREDDDEEEEREKENELKKIKLEQKLEQIAEEAG